MYSYAMHGIFLPESSGSDNVGVAVTVIARGKYAVEVDELITVPMS